MDFPSMSCSELWRSSIGSWSPIVNIWLTFVPSNPPKCATILVLNSIVRKPLWSIKNKIDFNFNLVSSRWDDVSTVSRNFNGISKNAKISHSVRTSSHRFQLRWLPSTFKLNSSWIYFPPFHELELNFTSVWTEARLHWSPTRTWKGLWVNMVMNDESPAGIQWEKGKIIP